MSDVENVYVNSSHFSANAGKAFSQLWGSEDFSDVTLATGDRRQIKAHKIVLSSSSNFFKDILSRNIHPNPLLYLKDTLHEHLELLLKFIYQGECEVKTEMLEQFLDLGKHFEVKGLVQDTLAALVQARVGLGLGCCFRLEGGRGQRGKRG